MNVAAVMRSLMREPAGAQGGSGIEHRAGWREYAVLDATDVRPVRTTGTVRCQNPRRTARRASPPGSA